MNLKLLKNFSTAALLSALGCQASATLAATSSQCEFSEQAPDTHLVVSGDTLWDLAALFLKDPWCWPQVWEHNHEQIRNPHWIYPGQTVFFKRAQGQLSLSNDSEISKHMSPQIRSEQLESVPLSVLPPTLQSIITRAPLLLDDNLPVMPRIVAIADEHQMAGRNDRVYVTGELAQQKIFNVVRTAQPVTDPESRRVIGYSAMRTGTLMLSQLAAADKPHSFTVTASGVEIRAGDVLVAASSAAGLVTAPHPAIATLDGHIAAVLRGSRWANQYDVVAINRGQQHGLDAGSVLSVMKQVRISAQDSAKKTAALAALPAQQIGTLLVFNVSKQASLALVMRAGDGIAVGDRVLSVKRD